MFGPTAHIMAVRGKFAWAGIIALLVLAAFAPSVLMAITPEGTEIRATATAKYQSSSGEAMPAATSNTVTTTVQKATGVVVSPSSDTKLASPGDEVNFAVSVTNSGSVSDTFDLAASASNGSTIAIYRDDNNDGQRQSTETTVVSSTGALAAGAAYRCFVAAQLDAESTPVAETITFTAQSQSDSTVTGTATLTVQDENVSSGPYIQRWLINGYYSNSDRSTRLSTDYLGGEASVTPVEGGEWFRADTSAEYLDLNAIFGAQEGCAAYAAAYVYSPTAQEVGLSMGSDDGIKVWLNGSNVWTNDTYRGLTLDEDKTTVSLAQGWNTLLAKVSQGGGSWHLSVKLCDSAGNQIPGLVYALAPTVESDETPPTISGFAVTSATNSAVIAWTTDEPSTSLVEYGTTADLGESAGDDSLARNHSITLTGLTAETTYYVKVGSADASGNTAWIGPESFTTQAEGMTPPPASGPYIETWLLNGYYPNADKAIRLSQDYLGGESGVAPVEGVEWFRYDSDSEYVDLNYAFGTQRDCAAYAHAYVYSPADQTVGLLMGSNDGIKVWINGENVWTNDVWRSFVIDKDETTVALKAGWNRMLVKISQDGGSWGFSIKFCDSSGNQVPGIAYSIAPDNATEPPPADTTPPVISGVTVTPTATDAVVEWATDEPATSLVEYGPTEDLGGVAAYGSLTQSHLVTLSGLTASTTYYLRVGSVDASGNEAWSEVGTFRTADVPQPPPPSTDGPYIETWLLNGYYPNTDKATRLSQDYLGGESGVAPVEGGEWFRYDSDSEYVDLNDAFGTQKYCTAYAHAYVYSPADQTVGLLMGSNDGIKVWINGENVWTNDVWRSFVIDKDETTVALKAGWNRMLVKISQDGGSWGFSIKFCDSSGNQIPGVVYALAPSGGGEDTTAPAISRLTVTPGATSATVEWTTDEPASSTVEIDGAEAASDATLRMTHRLDISGLAPETEYVARVYSVDASGNVGSADTSFTTRTEEAAYTGQYVRHWLTLGPVFNPDRSTLLTRGYTKADGVDEGDAFIPVEGEELIGLTWKRLDHETPDVDLGAFYGDPTECVAYLYTNVYSPAAQTVQFRVGTDDGFKVWVNGGASVYMANEFRAYVQDEDVFSVDLNAGWNTLLFKVSQGTLTWRASLRICMPDGTDVPGLTYSP